MVRPSPDHAGEPVAIEPNRVNCFAPEPSALATQISLAPLEEDRQAMRFPSGDNCGAPSPSPPGVIAIPSVLPGTADHTLVSANRTTNANPVARRGIAGAVAPNPAAAILFISLPSRGTAHRLLPLAPFSREATTNLLPGPQLKPAMRLCVEAIRLGMFRSGRGGQRVGSELLPLNHAAILNSTEKSRRA